jgi:hypothetical protein
LALAITIEKTIQRIKEKNTISQINIFQDLYNN